MKVYCANCLGVRDMDVHGRCAACGSLAVDTLERLNLAVRPKRDEKEQWRKELEEELAGVERRKWKVGVMVGADARRLPLGDEA